MMAPMCIAEYGLYGLNIMREVDRAITTISYMVCVHLADCCKNPALKRKTYTCTCIN